MTLIAAVIVGASQPQGIIRRDSDVISRVRIINFDQSVARHDKSTGAIHRFNGNLDNPSVRSSWILHVKGVDKKTSGYLELQSAGGATFLVDVVAGDTWILRRRASSATWDEVKIAR
jgi:hypothetical protein